MGTRAIITINEKPYIATHWDGYPSALGAELAKVTAKKDIRAVSKNHKIDFEGKTIARYDDWADYQYDLHKGEWRYKALSGTWKEHGGGEWRKLGTTKSVLKVEKTKRGG